MAQNILSVVLTICTRHVPELTLDACQKLPYVMLQTANQGKLEGNYSFCGAVETLEPCCEHSGRPPEQPSMRGTGARNPTLEAQLASAVTLCFLHGLLVEIPC